MTIIRRLLLLGIIFFSVSFFACQQPQPQTNTKLKILTTFAPLYCFTMNITGDLADIENLLPSGVGPHGYSFSPADIKKIREAQVIIKNGVNLENWLDKLIASAGRERLIIVDTSSGVDIINNDPHIWLSPRNAIVQIKNIMNALIKADPDNSKRYMENAEKYINRLGILDKDIRDEIKTWKRKDFVAFHSAFLYFARDYGLKQAAVIQESPEKEPSPKHLADVINIIKIAGVKAIFSEPQFSPKMVESIAQDLKLQVYTLDTLETGMLNPAWYEDRMRANLAIFKKALK